MSGLIPARAAAVVATIRALKPYGTPRAGIPAAFATALPELG